MERKKKHTPVTPKGSADDGKHLRCREFPTTVEGWWGVRGEEGDKNIGLDCLWVVLGGSSADL